MSSSSVFDSLSSSSSSGYSYYGPTAPTAGLSASSSSSLLDSGYGRRASAYSTSAYSSSPYTSTYSSSYGSGGGDGRSSSSRLLLLPTSASYSGSATSASYGRHNSYLDDHLTSLKKDRYGTSSDYYGSGRHAASRSSSSSSSYAPRYLMNSDLLSSSSSEKSAVGGGVRQRDSDSGRSSRPSSKNGGSSSSSTAHIGSAPSYDRFGNELSNYERWKVQRAGGASSGDYVDASRITSDSKSSTTRRRNKDQKGVRFAEEVVTAAANDGEADTAVDLRSNLFLAGRELSVGPSMLAGSSSSSSTGTTRTARSTSMRPDLASTSSYRPSFGSSSSSYRSFPAGVADKLSGYDVEDVKGDGGCYYRCLSLYFTGSESGYMRYRREVLDYIRDHLDSYSTMIRSELTGSASSTSDYFQRKTRADRQDWAETTEIIATCCVYNINVHVLALVPGRYSTWQWLHFDPSIGTGKPSNAARDVYLYNAGSVHFMLCTPKRASS